MASRTTRRIVFFSVLVFFLVGLLFIEQRPKHDMQKKLFSLIHDMVNGPSPDVNISPDKKVVEETPALLDACTIQSPLRGFIDLRELSNVFNDGKAVVWHARGFDSGQNYSLGVCLSPVKRTLIETPVRDGLNVSEVGAFYHDPKSGHIVLMGQLTTAPVFQGHRLTLTYNNGSYCDATRYSNGEKMRRKTIVTFTCDRDMMTKAHLSYVASVDDCTYLFEMRSPFACPTSAKADNLAALWIFLLILLAALMVFFSGGFLYRNMKR